MFFYEGYTCPVCGKPFGPSDDIVACPTCGAPHHRDCWQREGHCHYETDHGTERQWSREKNTPGAAAAAENTTKNCPNCGFPNPAYAEFCSRCGRPTGAEDWSGQPQPEPRPSQNAAPPPFTSAPYGEYAPFHTAGDPYGGVSPDEKIDSVPAAQLVAFTGTNTAYYLPRFKKMAQQGSTCSWNWAAFLLTPYWLLFRKNYLSGVFMLIFEILRTALNGYLIYGVMDPYLGSQTMSMFEATRQMMADSGMSMFIWILMLSYLAELLLRLFFGLAGNRLYLHTAVSRIRKLRVEDNEPALQDIAAAGGVSFGLGITAYSLLLLASMMVQYAFLL